MPQLPEKPEKIITRQTLSAEALDQVRRSQTRQIKGAGDAQASYYGDRIILESKTIKSHLPDPTNYIAQFVVLSEGRDYLLCSLYAQPHDDTGWIPQPYDATLNQDSKLLIYVAKPYWLQQTPWDGRRATIGNEICDFVYDSSEMGKRTAFIFEKEQNEDEVDYEGQETRIETISPAYTPGDIITAVRTVTGYTDVLNNPIVWMDANEAGRSWRSRCWGKVRLVKKDYTVEYSDRFYLINVDATTQDITIYLPIAPEIGFVVWIRRIDAQTQNAAGTVPDPIHEVAILSTDFSYTLEVQGEVFGFFWTGKVWATFTTNSHHINVAGYDGLNPPRVPSTLHFGFNLQNIQTVYADGVYMKITKDPLKCDILIGGVEANVQYQTGHTGDLNYIDYFQNGIVTSNAQLWAGRKSFWDGGTTYVDWKFTERTFRGNSTALVASDGDWSLTTSGVTTGGVGLLNSTFTLDPWLQVFDISFVHGTQPVDGIYQLQAFSVNGAYGLYGRTALGFTFSGGINTLQQGQTDPLWLKTHAVPIAQGYTDLTAHGITNVVQNVFTFADPYNWTGPVGLLGCYALQIDNAMGVGIDPFFQAIFLQANLGSAGDEPTVIRDLGGSNAISYFLGVNGGPGGTLASVAKGNSRTGGASGTPQYRDGLWIGDVP